VAGGSEYVQIMPPGDWIAAGWDPETEGMWTEPLVGWAIQRFWSCPGEWCGGLRMCPYADSHEREVTEVIALTCPDGQVVEELSWPARPVSGRELEWNRPQVEQAVRRSYEVASLDSAPKHMQSG
jgi:hypothetical protein